LPAPCLNGAAYPRIRPIVVKVGERLRLRFRNASPSSTHYVRLAGHRLRITHSDGNPLRHPVTVDALRLGPAERCDAWVRIEKPGAWRHRELVLPCQFAARALAVAPPQRDPYGGRDDDRGRRRMSALLRFPATGIHQGSF
jgi:FtsP/CotA-like multicopper oxidase with cupredoxin domain